MSPAVRSIGSVAVAAWFVRPRPGNVHTRIARGAALLLCLAAATPLPDAAPHAVELNDPLVGVLAAGISQPPAVWHEPAPAHPVEHAGNLAAAQARG